MSTRTNFKNQAREYYQRHHMSETPHPHDVSAMATELHNAFVAGQETEAGGIASEREACATLCDMAESDARFPVEVRALAAVLARTIRKREVY